MKTVNLYLLFIGICLITACSKELPPVVSVELTANPNPVAFLGSTLITWDYPNATECYLNGKPVSAKSNIIIGNLVADSTLTLAGKIKSTTFTKNLIIKVQEKPANLKLIDSLTIGRWKLIEMRALGLHRNANEWNIMDFSTSNTFTLYEKDKTYKNLQYSQLDEEFLHLGPVSYSVSDNAKYVSQSDFYKFRLPENYEILKISRDSLILYNKDAIWTSAGSDGSGNGIFPTIIKYTRDNSSIEIVNSNNPNTENFKILTGHSWLHHSTKFIQSGVEEIVIWNDIRITKYYSNGTAEIFDNDNNMVGNGIRWYLINNETKLKLAGGGNRMDIIKLTNTELVISREQFNERGKYIAEATYYAKN